MDLASHILRMVPWNWQNQYELSGATVPKSVKELLEALKLIEKAYPTDTVVDGPKNSAKLTDSSKRKIVSFDKRISKTHHQEKQCSLCKEHGGPHTTHNTRNGLKYESNGTLKKSFSGKKFHGSSNRPKRPNQGESRYAQLSAEIDKIEEVQQKNETRYQLKEA